MGCSDRHGLVLGHVQVGIDAISTPGEVQYNQSSPVPLDSHTKLVAKVLMKSYYMPLRFNKIFSLKPIQIKSDVAWQRHDLICGWIDGT